MAIDNETLLDMYTKMLTNRRFEERVAELLYTGELPGSRESTDVTVVAIGPMVQKALTVANDLAKDGISVEVVDPRTLVPIDKQAITSSVKKTGRLMIADDAPPTCGPAAEIAVLVVKDDDAFGCLDAPIQRVTRQHVPIPFSHPLENFVVPDEGRIKTAVQKVLQ